ncbi:MAG: exo 1,3/1,4-beta-D-glucan glucohydrolase [Gammaproteobacteria bacterium]|nr:exo 1,3/1,4-beta-D-glucan glucohydrolase [Gammaproteobacteria bacterium]NVK88408.1 exo 1,3/1,4-beta-D-glucan glucohydrolase [Gammaproteobacteria bacterium]
MWFKKALPQKSAKVYLRGKQLLISGVVMVTINLVGCDKSSLEGEATPQNLAIWPEVAAPLAGQEDVEREVASLLATLTLEQKVAQMIQPEIRDFSVEDMRKYGFGSFLNGGGSFPNQDKQATPADWLELADAMYRASVDDSIDGTRIPTMWGTDAVHGHTNVKGATIFPHNIGLGAAHNSELVQRIAEATAKEVAATGIDWVFAPTVAVARDDRWGRAYESYSEDPDLVAEYADAFVRGMQGEPNSASFLAKGRTLATLKHFIGDGGTRGGDDQGDNDLDEQSLYQIHGRGYERGIAAAAQFVMASFNSWQGEKLHGHHYLLQRVLKDRMGFDGVVVGDWNGHGQVAGCRNDDCPAAINAGVDILMAPGQSWKPLFHNTVAQVKAGVIDPKRIDDAVTRILRVKLRAGLIKRGLPSAQISQEQQQILGAEAHRSLAREAVRQSLVLLKNNQQLLPLQPNQHFLVAGPAADNIGQQSGGWTLTWQGTGNQNADFPGATSIYQGLKEQVVAAGGTIELSATGSFQQQPDVAIVVFGEQPYAEGNGDLSNLEFERGSKRSLQLLTQLQRQGIKTVAVFISGRPLWVNPEINQADAFVAAWLPGSEGAGIADVLLTDAAGAIQYDFKGRLPFSWPNRLDQAPLNAPYLKEQPLFPLGFGLSYKMPGESLGILSEQRPTAADRPKSLSLFNRSVQAPYRIQLQNREVTQVLSSSSLAINGLQVRTVDRRVQEDALRLQWESNVGATLEIASPFTEDLRDFARNDAVVALDIRLLQVGEGPLWLRREGFDLRSLLNLQQSSWQRVAIPLKCIFLAEQLAAISVPFALTTQGAWQVEVSDIAITHSNEVSDCEGNLDFE